MTENVTGGGLIMAGGRGWRGGLRSGLLAALGVLIASTVLMVVPSPLVSPAGAQSVCDGPVDGFPTTVTSTGVDAMADRLRGLRDGVDLEPARAGFRWRVPVCMEDTAGGEVYRVRGPATEVVSTAAPMWELGALAEVRADLEARFWRPAPRLAPDLAGKQVVGLETWLAIDPGTWETFTATATFEEVTVSATATPVRTVWTFPDMVLRCNGPGVIYDPAVGGRPPCGRHWDHTSEVEPMSVQVQIEYQVTWTSSIDNSGTTTWTADPLGTFDLFVGEIQSLGTRGDNPPLWDPGFETRPAEQLPDCTLIMIVEGDCATGVAALDEDVKRCVDGGSIGDFLRNPRACLNALRDSVVEGLMAAAGPLQSLVSVLEGCFEYASDVVSGLWSTVGTVVAAGQNPVAWAQTQIETFEALTAAVAADPRGFAEEFLGDQLELDLLESDPAKWIGKIGCEVAVTLFTGGALAAGGRIAKLLDRIDDINDWTRNKRYRDHANVCGTSSFPTGTPVRMANGALKPIELVQPGDWILAADPRTRHWEPQVVLDQWSYVDRGRMTTATLTNGTTITATDHHQFWVTNTNTWHRLDQIRPGDRLLTPHGTTTITNVHTSNPTTTLVWELDTAAHDTFTVHTGTHDLLVHNQNPCKPSDAVQNELNRLREERGGARLPSNRYGPAEAVAAAIGPDGNLLVTEPRYNLMKGSSHRTGVDGNAVRALKRTLEVDKLRELYNVSVPDYLDRLDALYRSIGVEGGLHPELRGALERLFEANGNQLPIGAYEGLPGTHAEIIAVNDLLLQGVLPVDISVGTIKTTGAAEDFAACANCSPILELLGVKDVVTGVQG